MGYLKSNPTGYFGSATRNAVKDFQHRHDLTQDGIAGKKTLDLLYSSEALPAEEPNGTEEKEENKADANALVLGDKGDAIRALQIRLKELGYFFEEATGYFGEATQNAVKAFQQRNGLKVTGTANTATQNKLLSSSALTAAFPKYQTERLDWFNGGEKAIRVGASFMVKDVRTGLMFTAKRQGGENHLDAEPLTAADTAILLKIYGGEAFDWHRRPMLVKYNGHVYACSIYGEPHGSNTVSGNGYAGQFCLHFYMSRTHETDHVDADHQKCEATAMKASW